MNHLYCPSISSLLIPCHLSPTQHTQILENTTQQKSLAGIKLASLTNRL